MDAGRAFREGILPVLVRNRPLFPISRRQSQGPRLVSGELVMKMKSPSFDSLSTSTTLLKDVRNPQDHEAWEKFIARYGPMIRGWCRHWFPREADAKAHEVISELVFRMMTFEYNPNEGRFRGWLKTLTHNLMARLKREEWPHVNVDGECPLDILEAGEDLEARLAREFDLEQLEMAREQVALVSSRTRGRYTWPRPKRDESQPRSLVSWA